MAGGEERTLRDSAIGRGRRGARLQTEYRDQPNHVTTVERRRDAGQGLLCTPMEVDCHPTHFNFEAASRSSAQSTPSQPAPRRATPEHMTSELVSMTPQRSEGRWDGTTPSHVVAGPLDHADADGDSFFRQWLARRSRRQTRLLAIAVALEKLVRRVKDEALSLSVTDLADKIIT